MKKGISVQIKVSNQKVAEDLKKIISSIDGFYVRNPENMGPCDLLILEVGNNLKKEIHLLHSIRTSGLIRELFLISPIQDPVVLIQAKRASGAKRIFVHPLQKEELRNALLKFQEKENAAISVEEKKKSGKIIYLMGCKGGVGTTTVAVNLASSLAEKDKSRSVVLTDMILPFGDMPILLNIKASPNWVQLCKNISRIDSASIKSILFEHPIGFFVLPSSGEANGGMTPGNLEKLLSVFQEGLDFILIDGGKSFTETSIKALKMAEMVLMTTGLSHPCVANVKRLFSMIHKIDPSLEEKIKIIVNRYQKNSSIPLEEVEQELEKKIFWKIPNDFQAATEAINQGKTLCEVGSGRGICKAFRELAALLLVDGKKESEKKGFLGRLINETPLLDLTLTFDHKPKSA